MAVSQIGHQVLDLLMLFYSVAWLNRGKGGWQTQSEASHVSTF